MDKKDNSKMNRRTFIKNSAAIGVTSLIGGKLLSETMSPVVQPGAASGKSIISSVEGTDYYKNTIRAVKGLGGMKKFVSSKSRVAILANAQRYNPGTFTRPIILAAVIKMCQDAGADKINCLTLQSESNWEKTGLKQVVNQSGANLVFIDPKNEANFKKISIPRGKALKEAMIMNEFYENDVFINLPITKDHAGNKFTATLKNLMGLNAQINNRSFHQKNWRTDVNSITHLDQCIADLNLVVKPDLCIVDATEFIITNGPFGPGELKKANLVVAGTDRVAIDSYCCQLWGLDPQEIIMIRKAYEHKLGEIESSRIQVKHLKI